MTYTKPVRSDIPQHKPSVCEPRTSCCGYDAIGVGETHQSRIPVVSPPHLTRCYNYKAPLILIMPEGMPAFAFASGPPMFVDSPAFLVVPQQQQQQQQQSRPLIRLLHNHNTPFFVNSPPLPLPPASSGLQPSTRCPRPRTWPESWVLTVPRCTQGNNSLTTATTPNAIVQCRSIRPACTQACPPLAHNPSTPEIHPHFDFGPHALAPCAHPLLSGSCSTRPP